MCAPEDTLDRLKEYVAGGEAWRATQGERLRQVEQDVRSVKQRVGQQEELTRRMEITLERMDARIGTLVTVAKVSASLLGLLLAVFGAYLSYQGLSASAALRAAANQGSHQQGPPGIQPPQHGGRPASP